MQALTAAAARPGATHPGRRGIERELDVAYPPLSARALALAANLAQHAGAFSTAETTGLAAARHALARARASR